MPRHNPRFTFVPHTDFDRAAEFDCAICLDPWIGDELPSVSAPCHAAALVPCGHVFCAECIRFCRTCPLCRSPIATAYPPSLQLLEVASQIVRVKCLGCRWEGSKKESLQHSCGGARVDERHDDGTRPALAPGATAVPPRYATIYEYLLHDGEDPPDEFNISNYHLVGATSSSNSNQLEHDDAATQRLVAQYLPPRAVTAEGPVLIAPEGLTRPWKHFNMTKEEYLIAASQFYDMAAQSCMPSCGRQATLTSAEVREYLVSLAPVGGRGELPVTAETDWVVRAAERLFSLVDVHKLGIVRFEQVLAWIKYNRPTELRRFRKPVDLVAAVQRREPQQVGVSSPAQMAERVAQDKGRVDNSCVSGPLHGSQFTTHSAYVGSVADVTLAPLPAAPGLLAPIGATVEFGIAGDSSGVPSVEHLVAEAALPES